MKRQLTVLVTYKSRSRHLVCLNERFDYDTFLGRNIFLSGYVIDSETLPIGTPLSTKLTEWICNGLLEKNSYYSWNWDKDVDIIEIEHFPNWLDKLFGKFGDK